MKIVNIKVDRDTYLELESGKRLLDVRIDVPPHQINDIVIYTMVDENGGEVEGANLAFLITTKVHLENFAQRIGEQMTRLRGGEHADDLVIITLSKLPGQD